MAITPVSYLTSMASEPAIESSLGLISDLRGLGGTLIFLGTFMFYSIFKPLQLTHAINLSVLVYSAFVVFRSIGFIMDGLPGVMMTLAVSIEAGLAFWGLWLLNTHTRQQPSSILIH